MRATFRVLARFVTKAKQRAQARVAASGHGICAAYCVQGSVRPGSARAALSELDTSGQLTTTVTVARAGDEVVHAQLVVLERGDKHEAHVFAFGSGAVVFWHTPGSVRKHVLKALRKAADAEDPRDLFPFPRIHMRDFEHDFHVTNAVDEETQAAFRNDAIVLPHIKNNELVRVMLAMSHGLAQSVELLVLERAVDSLAERTSAVPHTLSAPLASSSLADVTQLTAELLAARYRLSLLSDILDVPEFFWENSDLEHLYADTAAAVELRERANVLDARVAVIRDALELLNGEVRAQSSLRVERAILALIAVEVLLEVAKLIAGAG